jgi:hypothetical protein
MKDSAMPPTAASRARSPSRVPTPTASSPNAMRTPSGTATWVSGEISAWTGLRRAAPASWAWIEAGSAASKNRGLASFCRPAKQNVNPEEGAQRKQYAT